MTAAEQGKYAGIIHDETLRLTRLLDDLLNLSVLANGEVVLHDQTGSLSTLIDRAISVAGHGANLTIQRSRSLENVTLRTDMDRLVQVFINLIANAHKYCDAEDPILRIDVSRGNTAYQIDFIDNGSGIRTENQQMIFEKFSRVSDESKAGGAGLGLAICREIMIRLGGQIIYLPGQGGGAFRVLLPFTSILTNHRII